MQSRVGSHASLEEGKEPILKAAHPSRPFQLRLLQFLLLFLGIAILFSFFSMCMMRYLGNQNVITVAQSTILPCVQQPNSLENWVKSPLQEMNDSELLWRASFAPRIKDYPFQRTPKIAFMFLARGPLPMAPLWEKFFNGSEGFYSIYIHSLPLYQPDYPPSSVFYGRQIPSQMVEWGTMSMCDAERRLLGNALLDISNEWFVLLSEACIPLFNFTVVYRYISRSKYSFMGSFDEDSPFGRGRYNEHMSPEVNLTEWRKGSQWFEVDRKLAIDIVQDVVYYPKFEQFCRPACYVDEHYFPTMLTIQSPRLLANRSLTWVDWSRGGAHPATFGKDDLSNEFFRKLIYGRTCTFNNQPTSLCFMFARKFAPNALDTLLEHSMEFFGF